MRYLMGLLVLVAGGIGIAILARSRPAEREGIVASTPLVSTIPDPTDFFQENQLLRVDLQLAEDDWTALCCQTRAFATALSVEGVESPFTWFRGDVVLNGIPVRNVGIRKKGFFGSLDDERPSLKIDFDEFQDNPTLGGLKRITLNNNKQDRTLVSQRLAYRMFRNAGVPAPRCSFAKVTINGRDLGIYTHVESVDKAFLRRCFGVDSGNLYEGTLADFFPDRLLRFDPKTNQETTDRSDLLRLAELLVDDTTRTEDIVQQIDVDEFLAFWAIESLIGFWDGYCGNQNNFFVYGHPKKNKFLFIPWGADSTFNNRQFGFRGGGARSVKTQALLANRLYRDPEIRWLYRETLLNLMDSAWNEADLLAEVDQIETLLRDHIGPTQGEFVDALDETRSFIRTRRSQVMDEIKFAPLEVDEPPRKPMHSQKIGSIQGTFATRWNMQENEEPEGADASEGADPPDDATRPTTSLRLELYGETIELSELGVSATLGRGWGRGFGRRQSSRPAPALTFHGQRAADGQPIWITVNFNPTQFQAGTPAQVQGNLSEGEDEGGWGGRWGGRSLAGTAQLEAAGMEDGAPISGTLDVQLYEMQGGFFGRR